MADAATRVWSTDSAPAGMERDCWLEMLAETIVPCRLTGFEGGPFRASMQHAAFGPGKITFLAETAGEVQRTRADISRRTTGEFYLVHNRGRVRSLVEQGVRRQTVELHDTVLLSGDAPYRASGEGRGSGVMLALPTDYLRTWLPDPEAFAGSVFSARRGWGAALSAAMGAIEPDWPTCLPATPALVVDQLLSLLSFAAGQAPGMSRYQGALLRRLQQTLLERSREYDLDPETVAAVHGISKRHLHTTFAAAGTTFGRVLLGYRLEEARRLLEDSRFRQVSATEIAMRCGFAEASHFTRRFRERYGLSPTRYRLSVGTA